MSRLKPRQETADERLIRSYPWLSPATIKCLREQGVDPEDYAKRASRRREDPPGYIGQLPVSPEDQKRIDAEINRVPSPKKQSERAPRRRRAG